MAKQKVRDTGVEIEVLEALPELPGLPEAYRARGKADVLYVADAFAVMREVNRLLGATAPAVAAVAG